MCAERVSVSDLKRVEVSVSSPRGGLSIRNTLVMYLLS